MASSIRSTSDKVFLFWNANETNQREQYNSFKTHLIASGWRVEFIEKISSLNEFTQPKLVCLSILSSEQNLFDPPNTDLKQVLRFLDRDNVCLLVAQNSQETGQPTLPINRIVSKFGIKFQQKDCVIRPNPYKLYHPKEALLEDFIANRGLEDVLKSIRKRDGNKQAIDDDDQNQKLLEIELLAAKTKLDSSFSTSCRLLYPNGCTLRVENKVSTVLMTSSRWTLPSRQAICAINKQQSAKRRTRCIALGSADLFSDRYLNVEDNKQIVSSLLEFLVYEECSINISDSKTIEIPPNNMTADVEALANIPISCLKEAEPLPENVSSLIDTRLFDLNTLQMLPTILRAYKDLKVEHEKLSLMNVTKLEFNKVRRFEPAVHNFLLRPLKGGGSRKEELS